jgi:hypothetical protein
MGQSGAFDRPRTVAMKDARLLSHSWFADRLLPVWGIGLGSLGRQASKQKQNNFLASLVHDPEVIAAEGARHQRIQADQSAPVRACSRAALFSHSRPTMSGAMTREPWQRRN